MCLWKHFVPSTARLSLARLLQSKSQAHPNLTVKYVSTTVKREGFCSKHESNGFIKPLDTLAGISLYHHLSSSEFPDITIQSITLYNVLAVSQVYFNLKVSSSIFFFPLWFGCWKKPSCFACIISRKWLHSHVFYLSSFSFSYFLLTVNLT